MILKENYTNYVEVRLDEIRAGPLRTSVVHMKKFQCNTLLLYSFWFIYWINYPFWGGLAYGLEFFTNFSIKNTKLLLIPRINTWRIYPRTFLSLILRNSAGMPSGMQIDNKIRAPILHTLFSWARAVILFLRFAKADPKFSSKKHPLLE